MADFAKAQLLKYGWTEGKGLGKYENGIAKALKPKLKFDTAGIGHYSSEYHWWEFVYNKASNNLDINTRFEDVKINVKDENAVVVKTTESELNLEKMKEKHNLLYGNFIKISTLENGRITKSTDYTRDNFEKANEILQPFTLSDEDIFKACGGRTAHKGARHGLKLNGKLARIERQEQELLQKMNETKKTSDWIQVESKCKSQKRSHVEEIDVKKKTNTDTIETGTKPSIISNVVIVSTDDYISPQSRKTKRKAKRRVENLTQQLTTSLAILENPEVQNIKQSQKFEESDVKSSRKKKRKEKHRKRYCDEADVKGIINNPSNVEIIEKTDHLIEPVTKRLKKDVILEPSILNSKIEKKKKSKNLRKERKKIEKLSTSLMTLDLMEANI